MGNACEPTILRIRRFWEQDLVPGLALALYSGKIPSDTVSDGVSIAMPVVGALLAYK
jgi:hypothetical protein